MGLSLVSCEDSSDLGVAQVNPKPTVVTANGVTYTPGAVLTAGKINLGAFVNEDIPILNLTMDETFPETATITGTMQVSKNADYSNPVEIPITMTEVPVEEESKATKAYLGVVEGNLWEDAFVSFFNNDPREQVNYYRYILYIQNGTDISVFTGDYVDANHITVIPVDQKLDVESTYFIGGKHIGSNSIASAVKMSHSDKHEYDDPEFSFIADVTEETVGDYTWFIVPGSVKGKADAALTACYGVQDPSKESGILALMDSENGGVYGQLTNVGTWKVTVNMLTKTYSVTLAAPTLYVYGPATGNALATKRLLQIPTNDYINYEGVGIVRESFRLAAQKNTNGVIYGMGAAEGTLLLGDKGVTAITVADTPKNALFYITANVMNLTYTTYKINSIGIVTSTDEWSQDIAQLKPNTDFTVWTGEVTVSAPCDYKFRANGEWDGANWGGSLDDLTKGGANLTFGAAGTYSVTLNFSELPVKATVELK